MLLYGIRFSINNSIFVLIAEDKNVSPLRISAHCLQIEILSVENKSDFVLKQIWHIPVILATVIANGIVKSYKKVTTN